jgi:hypothetical protein
MITAAAIAWMSSCFESPYSKPATAIGSLFSVLQYSIILGFAGKPTINPPTPRIRGSRRGARTPAT